MTQTRDKLAREKVDRQAVAIVTHEQVGREVREAIRRIGGVLPEHIPADEHIKAVERRVNATPARLELDDRDAAGLLGPAGENDASEKS